MNKFSIKDIETITGIKSHTIRIWEQRYDFLKTKRTDTNIRYYDDDDLRLLLNVAALNDHGIKISEIAKMSMDEISHKVQEISHQETNYASYIKTLINQAISFNEKEFKKELANCIKKLGLEQSVLHVIYPFLQNIGVLWQTGTINPAQEHFASSLIKQKLIVAIDSIKAPSVHNKKKFLLFLPDGEFHEIALLFGYYILKSHGHEVLYLGQSLSLNYVKDVFKSYQPDYLFSVLTNATPDDELENTIKKFSSYFANNQVLLAGGRIQEAELTNYNNIHLLNEVPDLLSFLNELNFELV
jgi:DNA-binding transcriptional MerR regulator